MLSVSARSPWPSTNRLPRALEGTQDQETDACQPKLEPIADDIDLLYAGVVTSKRATRPKLEPIADDSGRHMDIATSKRASQPKLEPIADDSGLLRMDVATSKRASQSKLEPVADDSGLLHMDVATSKRASQPKLEAIADVIDLLYTDVTTNIQTVVKNETCAILPINAGNLNSIPEIYTHHMLIHALGYPLYIPEPDHGLSREYRKRGVRIGDVGSITPEGAFDFLFNICLPAGHPINPSELPDGFEMLPNSDISIIPQFIAPGDSRYSDGVLELDDQLDRFHCTTSEGAVLLLPGGATLFKSKNTPIFQDFAARHAENWYKYMVNRGRNTPNGSLYLVTGCIKSRNWANATFYQGPSPGNYAQLVANDVPSCPAPSNAQPAYRWKKLGKISPRIGPISEDTGELNQCEFLYGFKIMLRQDLLDKLSRTVSVSSQEGQYSPSSSTKAPASNRDCCGSGASTGSSAIKEEPHLGEGNTSRSHNTCFSGEVMIEADFPTASPLHPSDLINSMLLHSDPSAKVAITHDAVWCEMLLKACRGSCPSFNWN
ncbi:hypothetical protein M378DRAFT_461967 [Amanita muscaria Koide BX008]|uniref:Uncharacterized protein n=1 Tax=Amanita muscaria (strain Koide BX008) TaxID=946122 RepID=A0A0C2WVI6_AMAMK|nr:hypothetical protein M378DRAFT_461967 [Amanita muscaria Koide BX008]